MRSGDVGEAIILDTRESISSNTKLSTSFREGNSFRSASSLCASERLDNLFLRCLLCKTAECIAKGLGGEFDAFSFC